jgi:ubiquinone/menaquinone biosynthesis C-methylase UbiE
MLKINDKIREYWNEQAARTALASRRDLSVEDWDGTDVYTGKYEEGSTLKDSVLRRIEIETIGSRLPTEGDILDVGCGNGFSTMNYASMVANIKATGLDYASSMIDNANNLLTTKYKHIESRTNFIVGDMLNLPTDKKYDVVTSTRAVINLPTWEEQQRSILQMKSLLKPTGRVIMIEGNIQGCENTNEVRKELGLEPLAGGNWHNLHLDDEKLIPFLERHFNIIEQLYHSSTYYLVTRALYHKTLLNKFYDEFSYDEPCFEDAAKLPNTGSYGMHKLYVLEAK